MYRLPGYSARIFVLPICAVLSCSCAARAVDVISTYAGSGFGANNADGVAATSSSVFPVTDAVAVAVDAFGNVFFIDEHRVRRIDAASGIVTTVAGTGSGGFSGDGGPAIAAHVFEAQGLCVDSAGNVFIADTGNNRIRKVTAATGVISTVAGIGGAGAFAGDGGPSTAASLFAPRGVCIDSLGNVFIADTKNFCVRKVAAGTGIITTVAGQGGVFGNGGDGGVPTSATLGKPIAVVVDSGNQLFIADQQFNRVRMASAMITNFAGSNTGTSGYTGDGGLATSCTLNSPAGLAIDSSNNLYIADSNNNVVRVVDSSVFHINTIAGTGSSGFSGDNGPPLLATLSLTSGVAVGSGGSPDVFIYDRNNYRIRKIHLGTITTVGGTGGGAFADGPSATASFFLPDTLFVDPSGNVYVADANNNRIRKIDTSGTVTTVAGTGVPGFSGDAGPATSAQLNHPNGVFVDGMGQIFIADTDNSCVRVVNPAGIINTLAGQAGMPGFSGDNGPAGASKLDTPEALTADPSGNLYILDSNDNIIRKISGGIITTIAGSPGVSAFAGDGGPASGARFCGPLGLFFEPSSQSLFIADAAGARIRKIDAAGNVSTVAGNGIAANSGDGGPANAASLVYPSGVCAMPDGTVFITDQGAHVIRKIDGVTGVISTFAGTGVPGFSGDGGAATQAKLHTPAAIFPRPGALFILDAGNNRVRRTVFNAPPFIVSATVQTPILVGTPATITVAATDPENDTLDYIFDPGDGTGPVHTGNINTVTHSFSAAGLYIGTVLISDPYQSVMRSTPILVFAPASGGAGVTNVAQNDPLLTKVTDPVNGISVSVSNSDGGVVELFIDLASLTRDDFAVSTDYAGIGGRTLNSLTLSSVTGLRPVQQFLEQGIYVAKVNAVRTADNTSAGTARKTLVIDRMEVGDTALALTAPKSHKIYASSLKGNFLFGRSGAASASGGSSSVTLSGTIPLPGGLDASAPIALQVAIGNIVDSIAVDAKGNGKAPSLNRYIQKFQLRLPKPKKPATTLPTDKPASFSFTLSDKGFAAAANLVNNGFDTEGVSSAVIPSEKTLKTLTRQIQIALAINGVGYQSTVPVTFKRSSTNDSGSISGRSATK